MRDKPQAERVVVGDAYAKQGEVLEFSASFVKPDDFDKEAFLEAMTMRLCEFFGHHFEALDVDDCPLVLVGIQPVGPE